MSRLNIPQIIRTKSNENGFGLSRGDLETEIVRLYQLNDRAGVLDLFEAYKDWELKYRGESSEEETIDLAKSNLDFLCKVADVRIANREERTTDVTLLEAVTTPQNTNVGPIRRFYRETVDYHPFDPTMN